MFSSYLVNMILKEYRICMPMTVEEVCLIVQMYFNRVKCRFDMHEQSPPAGDYDNVNTRVQNVTSTKSSIHPERVGDWNFLSTPTFL